MGKDNGKGGAVDRFLGDLATEYEKLSTAEQVKHLSAGDALIASRKALLSKRQRPAGGQAGKRRIRVAR